MAARNEFHHYGEGGEEECPPCKRCFEDWLIHASHCFDPVPVTGKKEENISKRQVMTLCAFHLQL
jgi:hypothetical protein